MTNERTGADFKSRLITPAAGAPFVGGWLQILGFAAAIVCGTAAVRRSRAGSAVDVRRQR